MGSDDELRAAIIGGWRLIGWYMDFGEDQVHPFGPDATGGTRNHLTSLGDRTYLEVIGPDPDQGRPDGPRPFGIAIALGDDERVRVAAGTPSLIATVRTKHGDVVL